MKQRAYTWTTLKLSDTYATRPPTLPYIVLILCYIVLYQDSLSIWSVCFRLLDLFPNCKSDFFLHAMGTDRSARVNGEWVAFLKCVLEEVIMQF